MIINLILVNGLLEITSIFHNKINFNQEKEGKIQKTVKTGSVWWPVVQLKCLTISEIYSFYILVQKIFEPNEHLSVLYSWIFYEYMLYSWINSQITIDPENT